MIQSMHGEFDVLLGDFPEGHFLWEELADQAIHVLVGAALPGNIGMGDPDQRSAKDLNRPDGIEIPAIFATPALNNALLKADAREQSQPNHESVGQSHDAERIGDQQTSHNKITGERYPD